MRPKYIKPKRLGNWYVYLEPQGIMVRRFLGQAGIEIVMTWVITDERKRREAFDDIAKVIDIRDVLFNRFGRPTKVEAYGRLTPKEFEIAYGMLSHAGESL